MRATVIAATFITLLAGCAATESLSWKAERERYQARVALHQCIADKKAGKVEDCKGPIRDSQIADAAYENQRLAETRDLRSSR